MNLYIISVISSYLRTIFSNVLFSVIVVAPIHGQQQAISIITNSEKDLIPEGIAVDERSGYIYISSIAKEKIILVDNKGNHYNFVEQGANHFLEGLGMKVDNKRNLLWAISGKKQGNFYISQVHAFDLQTATEKQYYFLKDTIQRLFNDMVIRDDGKLYITDTYYSSVYEINPETKKLALLIKDPKIQYPNGIAIGENDHLYIATYSHGIMRYNFQSKELTALTGYKDSTMAFGLDGLGYYNNTLIGVYNSGPDRSTNTVVQYTLDHLGTKIITEKILDKGHSLFYEPTTLSIAGNRLYVLANSHLAVYNANKQSTLGVEEKLTPVAIVQYELKK
jgi:streptogramin lyase